VRAGEEIDVSCSYIWGDGKTFRVEQELRHADGALVAEITNVGGLLDLKQRRLLPRPGEHWRAVAGKADVLGL
jgi:acyl-CoA thioester hydrolase